MFAHFGPPTSEIGKLVSKTEERLLAAGSLRRASSRPRRARPAEGEHDRTHEGDEPDLVEDDGRRRHARGRMGTRRAGRRRLGGGPGRDRARERGSRGEAFEGGPGARDVVLDREQTVQRPL